MEGHYKVEENINFEGFLKAMGVTDEAKIEGMIKATKGGVKWNEKTFPPTLLNFES